MCIFSIDFVRISATKPMLGDIEIGSRRCQLDSPATAVFEIAIVLPATGWRSVNYRTGR
jgi:hypothetical protein